VITFEMVLFVVFSIILLIAYIKPEIMYYIFSGAVILLLILCIFIAYLKPKYREIGFIFAACAICVQIILRNKMKGN